MAVVRVQTKDKKGQWASIAQLELSNAQDYITCMQSDAFLEAVENHMRNEVREKVKSGALKEAPEKIEATHLRWLRSDSKNFRIVPAWKPETSIEQDAKTEPIT